MPETTTIELLPPADSAEAEAEEVTESPPTEAMEQPDQEPTAAAPKKRGRPAGAKNKAKPAPPVAAVVAEEIEALPPALKAKAKTKAKPKPKYTSKNPKPMNPAGLFPGKLGFLKNKYGK